MGNANGFYGSKSLNSPRQWLPNYISGYWVPEGAADKGRKAAYLAASLIFADLNGRAIEPPMVFGVASGMDHPQASYQYFWVWYMHFNKDDAFGKELVDGDYTRYKCVKYGEGSYDWPRVGVLAARPLTAVNGRAEVEALAHEMIELWNSDGWQ